jgi:hypothetical protein
MKSFSKNKLSLCFQPVVDIDAMLESKVAAHCSESWFMQHPKKRTVSKFIKAVILETLLVSLLIKLFLVKPVNARIL